MRSSLRTPPGPRFGLSLAGDTAGFFKVEEFVGIRHAEFGNVFTSRILGLEFVFVAGFENIKKVLTGEHTLAEGGSNTKAAQCHWIARNSPMRGLSSTGVKPVSCVTIMVSCPIAWVLQNCSRHLFLYTCASLGTKLQSNSLVVGGPLSTTRCN